MAKAKRPAKTRGAAKTKRATKTTRAAGKIDSVSVRMYCLGTGDCLVLKFLSGTRSVFTMMIDCGSCQGTPADFKPYINHLAKYVDNHLDLLVVTHEHNDHVNGFAKCGDLFKKFTIDEAWFAWTEDPEDPGGQAKLLQEKRKKMKQALDKAMTAMKEKARAFKTAASTDFFKRAIVAGNDAFIAGLDTLKEINLSENGGDAGAPLPGMVKIKQLLKDKKTRVRYLSPGETLALDKLPGFTIYVLGPPFERDFIFKDGKEGVDVFRRKLNFFESALAVNSFLRMGETDPLRQDIPFAESYLLEDTRPSVVAKIIRQQQTTADPTPTNAKDDVRKKYSDPSNPVNDWRKIDFDWLTGAGALALRLNSHINNTSLALAIEADDPEKRVLLLPGDAEYGSWESWHAIERWKGKGAGGKHLVEDLLNRTVFYKVGHHLSYNGTALEKGVKMMESPRLAAMATLDRNRIASKWKSTMPNSALLQELIRRSQGKLFIMDEFEIKDGPSHTLDPATLGKLYQRENFRNGKPIYLQYTVSL